MYIFKIFQIISYKTKQKENKKKKKVIIIDRMNEKKNCLQNDSDGQINKLGKSYTQAEIMFFLI